MTSFRDYEGGVQGVEKGVLCIVEAHVVYALHPVHFHIIGCDWHACLAILELLKQITSSYTCPIWIILKHNAVFVYIFHNLSWIICHTAFEILRYK